jgi:copper chaperone CopZ
MAADVVTYKAEMNGITCAGCKAHVTESFAKLEGYKAVEFVKGEKLGQQHVTLTATTADLTKEKAVAALGDFSKNYTIVSWEKK